MRNLVLLAVVLLAAGCGAYSFPGSPSRSDGTVSGRVLAIPCAPVEQPQDVCAGRPVPGVELDYTGTGCGQCEAVTDSRGDYAIALAPGDYKVTPKTYMRVIGGPLKITVESGSALTANYLLDSGIREPVPQA